MKRDLSIVLLLMAGVLAVFWGVWHFPFIGIDDDLYVERNPQVQRADNQLVGELLSGIESGHWHPLTWFWHRWDYRLYGLDAGGHHTSSLQFHLLNTLLLYYLLRKTTRRVWASAGAAALFAVHPMHVEPVVWISSHKDVLSTFFLLLMLVAYSAYVKKGSYWRLSLTALLLALGIMAKSLLLVAPALLLLFDLWPLDRLREGPINRRYADLGKILLEKLPFLALSLAAIGMAVLALRAAGLVTSLDRLPVAARLSYVAINYAAYLTQTFWPAKLIPLYRHPWTTPAASRVALAVVLLVAISIGAWRQRRSQPYLLVGWLWYLVTLVPVIGFLHFGHHIRADRYTYVPLIGIFIALAFSLEAAFVRWPRIRYLVFAMAVSCLCALGITARAQVLHWSSNLALGRHMVAVDPNNAGGEILIGLGLAAQNHNEEALAHYDRAFLLSSGNHVALLNRGVASATLGRFEEAITAYKEVVRRKPDCYVAEVNWANTLARLGRNEEALTHFKRALAIDPGQPRTHYNLGVFWERQGFLARAASQYRAAIELAPAWLPPRQAMARLRSLDAAARARAH
jgi:tetratricopeptide (TPR) repeat protein